jgi:hypothetical protein
VNRRTAIINATGVFMGVKVLAINGSSRRESLNQKLLDIAAQGARDARPADPVDRIFQQRRIAAVVLRRRNQ